MQRTARTADVQTMATVRVSTGTDEGILVESYWTDETATVAAHRLIDTVRGDYATESMTAKDMVKLLKTMGYAIVPGTGRDGRVSLCDPEKVRYCEKSGQFGSNGNHSSVNCYVRYTDLGFEPGETVLTFEEWSQS
jgi:hypothetical protein